VTAPGLVVLPEQAWESIKAELAALRLALLEALSKQSGVPVLAMSRDEASESLRIGKTSLDELIQKGELPSALVCGRRLVTVDDAKEYLAKQVAATAAAGPAPKRPRGKRAA
jgi:excisionase family DNA binding protein